MLKSLAQRILRAPAAVDGEAIESDPSALKGWMADLPPIGETTAAPPPAATPKKEPDGKTTDGTGGTTGTGLPADKKPDDAPKPTADAAPGGKVPDADSGATSGADKPKAGDDDAKAIIGELDKEKFPRHGTQWDDYKKKYGERLQNVETKLKGEIQAREEKLQAAEARIKTFEESAAKNGEQDPATKATIERLQQRNEALSEAIRRSDVTNHPDFKNHFGALENEQYQLLEGALGDAAKAKEFKEILAMPESQYKRDKLDEAIADLDHWRQDDVKAVKREMAKIGIAKQKAIDDELKRNDRLKAGEDAQRAEKQKQGIAEREKLTSEVLSTLQAEKGGMAVFQKRNGDNVWNEAVEKRVGIAKRFLTGEGLQRADLVRAAFHAAALPAVLEAYQADMRENATKVSQLEAQLKALTAAQPKSGTSGTTTATGEAGSTTTAPKPGSKPEEATNAFVKGLWAAGDQ